MKITMNQVSETKDTLSKIQRAYAYKYEVSTHLVSIMWHNKILHVLINGKLKERVSENVIGLISINESTGKVRGI